LQVTLEEAATVKVALCGMATITCGTCWIQNQHTNCTGTVPATPVGVGVVISAVAVTIAMGVSVSVSMGSMVGTSVSVGTSVDTTGVGVLVGGVPQALNTPSITATNKSNKRFFFIFLSLFCMKILNS
jgi:hypothetical protein